MSYIACIKSRKTSKRNQDKEFKYGRKQLMCRVLFLLLVLMFSDTFDSQQRSPKAVKMKISRVLVSFYVHDAEALSL